MHFLSLALLPFALALPAQVPMIVRDIIDVDFDSCSASNSVLNITISPCEVGNGSRDDPCHFSAGSNYTITLTYVPPSNSSAPRANLAAEDPAGSGYAYSGQSFGACEYTACPIEENVISTYTYKFVTLDSPFNRLTFNTTDGLEGPSLMCASFPVVL
ncbi:hypothetical protein BD324DRAFT_617990 [Kockovaella imperatae]|uniref:Phosphatidylglycerol/phosphatidylinositol transfer protein n=1 Tax=Kockovaella imperatae TaxID=4999 RepID=A0A1Y1UN66_9TREE|nr:hypothetical protein BD324DRAFT_617990 [Kockovaella imperatae]ORX38957.1 hypothetical protein BD324DRAFT_617990 [Kockovaella imperatae]